MKYHSLRYSEDIDVKISYHDRTIILLRSSLDLYEYLVDKLLYGREILHHERSEISAIHKRKNKEKQ